MPATFTVAIKLNGNLAPNITVEISSKYAFVIIVTRWPRRSSSLPMPIIGSRFVGAPFAGRHFVDGAFFYDYVPYYYDYVPYYGNYCWQQVWTPSGWQWVDACAGYYGYGY